GAAQASGAQPRHPRGRSFPSFGWRHVATNQGRNTMRPTHVSKLLAAATPFAIAAARAIPAPAQADATPECNTAPGPEGIPGNADDPIETLECGENAAATGEGSTASGTSSTASGYHSTATGNGSTASGSDSVAIGYGSLATGEYSVAIGTVSGAEGAYSTAIGQGSRATADNSTAVGQFSRASSVNSTAICQEVRADGLNIIATGKCSFVRGDAGPANGAQSLAV